MKILVAIPSVNPDPRFLQDTSALFKEFEDSKHEIEVSWIRGKSLVEAQNEFARMILSSDHDALLFLEEDHWGHTPEMLDDLIKANCDIAAIGYYSRWPHYPLTLMRKIDYRKVPRDYIEAISADHFSEVDLCGFGMTLIHRRVLEAMQEPIFTLNNVNLRNVATDRNFCEKARSLGFSIMGIFGHNLVHAGIDKSNIVKKRNSYMRNFMRLRA